MAEIPHAGSVWRKGREQVTVERVWRCGYWLVSVRLDDGTVAGMKAETFLRQFRHVAEPATAGPLQPPPA